MKIPLFKKSSLSRQLSDVYPDQQNTRTCVLCTATNILARMIKIESRKIPHWVGDIFGYEYEQMSQYYTPECLRDIFSCFQQQFIKKSEEKSDVRYSMSDGHVGEIPGWHKENISALLHAFIFRATRILNADFISKKKYERFLLKGG